MKKLILFVFVFFACTSSAHAHGYNKFTHKSNHSHGGIGISAGGTSGFGITYRHEFAGNPFGIQLTGLPVIYKQNNKTKGFISGGFGMFVTVNRSRWGRAFIALNSSVLWSSLEQGPDPRMVRLEAPEEEDFLMYSFGAGAGLEFCLARNIGFSLEIPISVFFDKHGFSSVLPIPNVSILYRW